MSHGLKIVIELLVSVLGVGFMVWLLIRGLKRGEDPARILFKER